MGFDEMCPFSSETKAKKFMSNTPWYSLSLVEILERSAVAAWNTVDQHFHAKINLWCFQRLKGSMKIPENLHAQVQGLDSYDWKNKNSKLEKKIVKKSILIKKVTFKNFQKFCSNFDFLTRKKWSDSAEIFMGYLHQCPLSSIKKSAKSEMSLYHDRLTLSETYS